MLVNPVCKEFCEEIKKRKNLKKEIYLELLPIAWHPSIVFWIGVLTRTMKNMELNKDGVNKKMLKKKGSIQV